MANLKSAFDSVKLGIKFDNAGNLLEALSSYESAVNGFSVALHQNEVKNQQLQTELKLQLKHYLDKVNAIKSEIQIKNTSTHCSDNIDADEELIKRIRSTIINEKPKLKLSDVAGLEKEKQFLKQAVVLPINHPEIFSRNLMPYKGFLLFGPPGTGKSYLARAVAGEADGTTFFSLSASDLVSKYQGESEGLIKNLFKVARMQKPSIIFIDEIDSLAMSRSDNDGDGTRRIKTELFVQMEGASQDNSGVFVLAATNTPHALDDAFLRRFDKLLYVPLPSSQARQQMLQQHFEGCPAITSEVLSEAVAKTDGLSGSDISIIAKKAKMQDVGRLQAATHFREVIYDGQLKYTPCSSKSTGSIRMTLDNIPPNKLLYTPVATKMITCLGKHGPYQFYKSVKIGEYTLHLSNFFPVKIWPDSTILSIAETQLIWSDKNENFCSLRLYFLPENTPEGRRSHHGEDEVIALQDKVIIKASDLGSWLVDESEWHWGSVTPPYTSTKPPQPPSTLSKAFLSEKFRKNDKVHDISDTRSDSLVVLNYVRYSRLRGVLKRLEGSPELSNWLSNPLVLALGGRNIGPNCRLLFAKEVFEYPELEDHVLLCNHLAPKLKGRPRKAGRKRNPSLGSESNESETSSAGSRGSEKAMGRKSVNGLWKPRLDADKPRSPSNNGMHPRAVGNGIAVGATANGAQLPKNEAEQIEPKSTRSKRRHSQLSNANSPSEITSVNKSEKVVAEPDSKQNRENVDVKSNGSSERSEQSAAKDSMPVRPSVITIQETSQPSEAEVPRTKKMKIDHRANNNVDSTYMNHKGAGPSAIDKNHEVASVLPSMHTSGGANKGFAMDSRPGSATSQKDGQSYSNYVDKKHALIPPRSTRSTAKNSNNKNERTRGTAPHVDKERNRPQYIPLRFCSPSPFISTLNYPIPQMFHDPAIKKHGVEAIMPRSEIKHHPVSNHIPFAPQSDILDFSVKKGRVQGQFVPTPAGFSMNHLRQMEPELLDLTVKSGSHHPGASGNHNIFHNLADIPPPNAMNKLGHRLTSEVTLFPTDLQKQPTHHQQQHVINNPSHKQKKDRESSVGRSSTSRNSIHSPAVPQQQQSSMPHMLSNHRSRQTNSVAPGYMQQPLPVSRPTSTSSANSSSKSNLMSHQNPQVWRPMTSAPSSSYGSAKAPSYQPEALLHHPAPLGLSYGHNSKASKHSPPTHHNAMEHLPSPVPDIPNNSHNAYGPGHSGRSSAAKVSQQLAALHQQERESRPSYSDEGSKMAREFEKWSAAASFGPMLPPSAFYPKVDAAASHYAMPHLFGSPFLMPPGLMGLPPGALEQFQLYKDLLLQQGLPPQFPNPNWPQPGNGSGSGGSGSGAKERGNK